MSPESRVVGEPRHGRMNVLSSLLNQVDNSQAWLPSLLRCPFSTDQQTASKTDYQARGGRDMYQAGESSWWSREELL